MDLIAFHLHPIALSMQLDPFVLTDLERNVLILYFFPAHPGQNFGYRTR
jgi:hypothetical protein